MLVDQDLCPQYLKVNNYYLMGHVNPYTTMLVGHVSWRLVVNISYILIKCSYCLHLEWHWFTRQTSRFLFLVLKPFVTTVLPGIIIRFANIIIKHSQVYSQTFFSDESHMNFMWIKLIHKIFSCVFYVKFLWNLYEIHMKFIWNSCEIHVKWESWTKFGCGTSKENLKIMIFFLIRSSFNYYLW